MALAYHVYSLEKFCKTWCCAAKKKKSTTVWTLSLSHFTCYSIHISAWTTQHSNGNQPFYDVTKCSVTPSQVSVLLFVKCLKDGTFYPLPNIWKLWQSTTFTRRLKALCFWFWCWIHGTSKLLNTGSCVKPSDDTTHNRLEKVMQSV